MEPRRRRQPSLIPHSRRTLTDDLSGRLLAHEPGAWRVVSLPMVAEGPDDALGRLPGEWLWGDDAYGYAADIRERWERMLPRTRTALYQQRPSPDDGTFFRKGWLRPEAKAPDLATLRIYGGSDFATKEGAGDWTVHVVVGVDPAGKLWLLDLWREQTESDKWVTAFCDLVLRWKPIGWAFESGQIAGSVGPFLRREQRQRRAFVATETFPTKGTKSVRAQSIRGEMAMDGLRYVAGSLWFDELEAELLKFPAGAHDDQVDALGLVGQLLDRMLSGTAPKEEDPAVPAGAIRVRDLKPKRPTGRGRV